MKVEVHLVLYTTCGGHSLIGKVQVLSLIQVAALFTRLLALYMYLIKLQLEKRVRSKTDFQKDFAQGPAFEAG